MKYICQTKVELKTETAVIGSEAWHREFNTICAYIPNSNDLIQYGGQFSEGPLAMNLMKWCRCLMKIDAELHADWWRRKSTECADSMEKNCTNVEIMCITTDHRRRGGTSMENDDLTMQRKMKFWSLEEETRGSFERACFVEDRHGWYDEFSNIHCKLKSCLNFGDLQNGR